MKVLIIGAGNMGKTYAESFIRSNVVSRNNLFLLEHTAEKAETLKALTNNPIHTEPSRFIRQMDLVILSVKPQDFVMLSAKLLPYIGREQLVLSIMAGIPIERVKFELNAKKVVRAMPNLPAQLGLGMTVFHASKEVSKENLIDVQNLLSTTGKAIYAKTEDLIDAATAISGSGPAFVFYFMQAMSEVAVKFGFTESEAQLLVEQTFRGSVELLHRHEYSLHQWIQQVASKGGTTEAALASFESNDFKNIMEKGLSAALQRAKSLGKNY